jgi:hypothetical protein
VDWTALVFNLIDLRSFSNLWYWIALAVTWSSTSHWVLGVPWDMVMRARRQGGDAAQDFEDITRVNVNRFIYIADVAAAPLLVMSSFILTSLAVLGFYYWVEFCQAVFLLALPLAIVLAMSIRTARAIRREGLTGDLLIRRLAVHRVWIQILGMVAIFVTAFWGMLQNYNISILGPL